MIYLLIAAAALGHVAIFVAVINRLHATAWPRWLLWICDKIWCGVAVALPLGIGFWALPYLGLATLPPTTLSWQSAADPLAVLALTYVAVCCLAAVLAIAERIQRQRVHRETPRLSGNHTRVVSLPQELGHRPVGDLPTRLLSWIPLNEILQLSIHEKTLILPRLNPALENLRLTHLSDLHFSGQLSRSFYDQVVRHANAWESDLVVITGDVIDKPAYLDWIPDLLGQLRARLGVFFVLGNHELRLKDEHRVRQTLRGAGLIDVGKSWKLLEHKGAGIVVAGNELPWHGPAADLSRCPRQHRGQRPFRILLSHSPDQLAWARDHEVDLMLAGHTHGGQVQLPLVGPILSPSRQGSRLASGTFFYRPTLLHVSRGLAGTRPLRFRCPPELARLVLTAECPAPATGAALPTRVAIAEGTAGDGPE